MRKVKRLSMVGLGLAAMLVLAVVASRSVGRVKGVKDAAEAIASGKLMLKEYPPLPYPPGHQEYVQLLREQCGVEYEVPRLPWLVAEADFIQEVRGWNETMEAEVERKFGVDIFDRLHEEASQLWQKQLNPSSNQ
jgi:hypothetical protein